MNVLCTGVAHTLILSDKGEVYSIGSSEYGQLGRDVVGGNFHAPVRVVGARANDKGKYYFGEKRIVAISSGDYHCAAVGVDGTLYMWGDASNGKLGHGEEDLNESGNEGGRRSHSMPCVVHAFLHANLITHDITGIKVKVRGVSCGSSHTLCVDYGGEAWSWGDGKYGQLGHGDTSSCIFPKELSDFKKTKIAQISAGAKHSLALCDGGKLFSWGHGDHGTLGNGGYDGSPRPSAIKFHDLRLCYFVNISAGESHSAAVTGEGAVYTWGSGAFGKLGHQSFEDALVPKLVEALTGTTIGIARCAPFHTIFVTKILKGDSSGGLVYACGSDQYGRLGNGGDAEDPGDVRDDENSGDNGDSAVGSESVPLPCEGYMSANRVTCVAAGAFHNVACSLDGTLWGWGFSGHGRLGMEVFESIHRPCNLENLKHIPVTGKTLVGKDEENTGGANMKDLALSQSFRQRLICSISCGAQHTVALTTGGGVWAWGENDCGQLGLNDTEDRHTPCVVTENIGELVIQGITTGSQHTVVWQREESVFVWGRGTEGQLGYGNAGIENTVDIHVGDESSKPQRCPLPENVSIKSVTAGDSHTLFVSRQGKVYACGNNMSGQLGLGQDKKCQVKPKRVDAGLKEETIAVISAGNAHSAAVSSHGKLYTWGAGWHGRLGHGNTKNMYIPKTVSWFGYKIVTDVECGFAHTLALTSDCVLYAFGKNDQRLGAKHREDLEHLPHCLAEIPNVVAFCAAEDHSVAILKTGEVIAWGLQGKYRKLGDYVQQGEKENGPQTVDLSDGKGDEEENNFKTVYQEGSVIQKQKALNAGADIATGVLDRRAVSCYSNHTVVLDAEGRVYSWGYNGSGRLGHPGLAGHTVVNAKRIAGFKTLSECLQQADNPNGGNSGSKDTQIEAKPAANDSAMQARAAPSGGGKNGGEGTEKEEMHPDDHHLDISELEAYLENIRSHKSLEVSVTHVTGLIRQEPKSWFDENIHGIVDDLMVVKSRLQKQIDVFVNTEKQISHIEDKIRLAMSSTQRHIFGISKENDASVPRFLKQHYLKFQNLFSVLLMHPCYIETIYKTLVMNHWSYFKTEPIDEKMEAERKSQKKMVTVTVGQDSTIGRWLEEKYSEADKKRIKLPLMSRNAVFMSPDEHFKYIFQFIKCIYADLTDRHVSLRYLCLMKVILRGEVHALVQKGGSIEQFSMPHNSLFVKLVKHYAVECGVQKLLCEQLESLARDMCCQSLSGDTVADANSKFKNTGGLFDPIFVGVALDLNFDPLHLQSTYKHDNSENSAQSQSELYDTLRTRAYEDSKHSDGVLSTRVNRGVTSFINILNTAIEGCCQAFLLLPHGINWIFSVLYNQIATEYIARRGQSTTINFIRAQSKRAALRFFFSQILCPMISDEAYWRETAAKNRWGLPLHEKDQTNGADNEKGRFLKQFWMAQEFNHFRKNIRILCRALNRVCTRDMHPVSMPWLKGVNNAVRKLNGQILESFDAIVNGSGNHYELEVYLYNAMFKEYTRRHPLFISVPLQLAEYIQWVFLFLGADVWSPRDMVNDIFWGESGMLGNESQLTFARQFNPRSQNFDYSEGDIISLNFSVDLRIVDGDAAESNTVSSIQDARICNSCSCILPAKLAAGYSVRSADRHAYEEVVVEEHLRLSMPPSTGKLDDASLKEEARNREAARREIIASRADESRCRKLFSKLLKKESFFPEDIPQGDVLKGLIEYMHTRLAEEEKSGDFSSATESNVLLEQFHNIELQAKAIGDLLFEMLEELLFRKKRASRYALEKRMLVALKAEYNNYAGYIEKKRKSSFHFLDIIRNGVETTQNRTIVSKLATKKRIKLTPSNLCKSCHTKHPAPRSILNHYQQVKGIFQSFSYAYLLSKDVIRFLDLGPAIAVEEKGDDEGSTRTVQPLDFKQITSNLVYEFRSRNGEMSVMATYNKTYVIDQLYFPISEILKCKRLRILEFKTANSLTTFNIDQFLRLIEDIVMLSLLL